MPILMNALTSAVVFNLAFLTAGLLLFILSTRLVIVDLSHYLNYSVYKRMTQVKEMITMKVEITRLAEYMDEHDLGPTAMGEAIIPRKTKQRISLLYNEGGDYWIVKYKNKLKLMRFQ